MVNLRDWVKRFRRVQTISGQASSNERVGETFTGLRTHEPVVIEDFSFSDCEFQNCGTVSHDPKRRSILRNLHLKSCTERGCTLTGAHLEDCVVDGLKVSGAKPAASFIVEGCAFRHVTLKGRIGVLLVRPYSSSLMSPNPQRELEFAERTAAFYEATDWALDISAAKFVSLSIWGVPARLIRRDTLSQIVITREKAMEGKWRELDLADTYWPSVLEGLLKRGDSDAVLVAPKAAKDYAILQRGLDLIRDAGICESEP